MKDQLLLLLAGLVCAAGAALFFWFFGEDAFGLLMAIMLACTVADNARLRRRLRGMGARPEGKRTWL